MNLEGKAPSDMTREELLELHRRDSEFLRNQSEGVKELYAEIKQLKDEVETLKITNKALAFAYGASLKEKK